MNFGKTFFKVKTRFLAQFMTHDFTHDPRLFTHDSRHTTISHTRRKRVVAYPKQIRRESGLINTYFIIVLVFLDVYRGLYIA